MSLHLVGTTDPRVQALKGDLVAKAALMSIAQDDLIRAVASEDTDAMCTAAYRVQTVGSLVGEAARKHQRSSP